MQKFRFRDFRVYNESIKFRREMIDVVKQYFPKTEQFILTDQILRALNSIVLNIAEGSDRGTDKDFALFLNRAYTSLCEVVACLDLALEDKYITKQIHDEFLKTGEGLANQITGFRYKLLHEPTK